MTAFEALKDRPRPYIMAHRGNSARCPENTMAAFRRAVDDGADIIETDLHISADGVVMCIHDDTVDRTTDGSGAVNRLTCAELQTFDASYGRSEFAGERIPALEEVLEWLPRQTGIALELKADAFLDAAACLQLLNLLETTAALDRALVISFSRARLEAMQRAAPLIATGVITMRGFIPGGQGAVIGPFWPLVFINPLYVYMAHRRGQLVAPLDPAPEPRLWYYRFVGCDAVLTNDPGQTAARLKR